MRSKNIFLGVILLVTVSFFSCQNKDLPTSALNETNPKLHDSIVEKYLNNCAMGYGYNLYMKEWQECLDKGLAQDSTIAYLWQQKAMPYFKARKYEVGMEFLDKAVKYKPKRWLSYRAFIKCMFSKQYKAAIIDFEEALELNGFDYEMDHSYHFYIALSHLQLNHFEKAEDIFSQDVKKQEDKWGEAHYIDLFYYAITKYELGKYEEAIVELDKALKVYTNFSDAKYYKAFCLAKLGKNEEFRALIKEAKVDARNRGTFNEDNSIYEQYPYQVRWP